MPNNFGRIKHGNPKTSVTAAGSSNPKLLADLMGSAGEMRAESFAFNLIESKSAALTIVLWSGMPTDRPTCKHLSGGVKCN